MDLIERDAPLAALQALLEGLAAGGRIALVAGEAGIGKTSLLRALAGRRGRRHGLWWGACDALQTPHPLAPLYDIAAGAEVRFRALLHGDSPRPALFEAVLDELRLAPAPTLVVVDDVHWADDATLDWIKHLGRRIDRVPALLVLGFRDDELAAAHPLRRVLGELPAARVERLQLPRLSAAGVERLAQQAQRGADGLHALTLGNPFFVSELLRQPDPDAAVPATVQDLVLARFGRLAPGAQALVQLAALVPGRIERWLVDAVLAPTPADLQAGLDSGLLLADGAALRFRHELARIAVEGALAPPLAQPLHARLLAALDGQAPAPVAAARRAHHALLSGDAAAVRRWAVAAAEEAHARGAHREAARHWRAALGAGAGDDAERARWLEAWATECQTTDQLDDAIAARAELDRLHRACGDVRRQAENLTRLALVRVLALRNADADAACRQAIELLEPLPPCPEQAQAYWVDAQLRMLNRECAAAADRARRAIALAERFGDRHTLVAAHGTLGAATMFIDFDAGVAELERALRIALADGLHWVAANSYINLGSAAGELGRYAEGERWLAEGIAYATAHEVDFYRYYGLAWLARCELHLGRWPDAERHADEAAQRAGAATTSRIMALVALGRLRTRRGDDGADALLETASALAAATGTLQRVGPVAVARAEAALARGNRDAAAAAARDAFVLAQARAQPWLAGELGWCLHQAGALDAAPLPCSDPHALLIAGRWRDAAAAWAGLGCPWERAQALALGDEAAMRDALQVFDALGARPAADALRRRLRDAGARGVARGARASTRSHPCGLTAAEMQVLALLAQGLRNAAIAARLHRSVRTVDHHVASVLAKLGAASRAEAVRRAEREGMLDGAQSGQGRRAT